MRSSAVLTPITADAAVELANRVWVKKVLPVGDIRYRDRILHFTKSYIDELARAFRAGAYDQVPFQLADSGNAHTNDPERYAGQIVDAEARPDGLYIKVRTTQRGEAVLSQNPNLGVSARIVENYDRADGTFFPQALQHVLGTLDPRITGLGAWQAIEASNTGEAHMTGQPGVTIEVIPLTTGAHCGLAGAFALADVSGAGEIAYLDTVTDGYIAENAAVVAGVVLTFNTIRSEALPRKASRDLIMKRAEDYGSE
jgi:hypothetical protein